MAKKTLLVLAASLLLVVPVAGQEEDTVTLVGPAIDAALASYVKRSGYDYGMKVSQYQGLDAQEKAIFILQLFEGYQSGWYVVTAFGVSKDDPGATMQKKGFLLRGWTMPAGSYEREALHKIDAREASHWCAALVLSEARFARVAEQEVRAHALIEAAKVLEKACKSEIRDSVTTAEQLKLLRKAGKANLAVKGFLEGMRLSRFCAESGNGLSVGFTGIDLIAGMDDLVSRGVVSGDESVLVTFLTAVWQLRSQSFVE